MNKAPSKTVIVGLGITGYTCALYLYQKNIPFSIVDTRDAPPKLSELKQNCPGAAVYTGGFPPLLLSQAETIVLSPGMSKEDPSLQPFFSENARIIGDIELFAEGVTAPVVAITGSNGKSTVTSLVGEMAKHAGIRVGVGGNLGTPALSLLQEDHDLYVLELSSFQLETTYSLHPQVATLLNICYDHMDRYRTLEDYYHAKERIFNHADTIVVNRDDPFVLERINKKVAKDLPRISFGLNLPPINSSDFGVSFEKGMLLQGKDPLLPLSSLKLFGIHNIANALAALSLASMIKLPKESMLEALKSFPGLPHRCEWVRTRHDVQWINDSKGTNVGATIAALNGLKNTIPGKWILIAGGIGKNADFSPLKPVILDTCRAVILMGEAKKELRALLEKVIPCIEVKSMEDAVFEASKQAQSGDGVLLSPGCASFDMFKNFEHRGEVFKAAVKDLK